jgi:hypothetical protein
MLDVIRPFGGHGGRADGSVVGEVEVWVWRDDLGSGGALGGAGGWRLDGNNTWVWEEPSPLDRPGAGTGALRGYAGSAPVVDQRRPERGTERRTDRPVGDRALATLGDDPTPIFHELSVDRSRNIPRPSWRERDRDAVHVPEPHPGSGALPIQDEEWAQHHGRGLRDVPTVPPPPAPGAAEDPEDELRRRAERRRRPMSDTREDAGREGGRHTWRREETRSGRHALRR